mmetsp:Transcript_6112/g.25959  ORF Transcript_6112/g.25959 Transcript_6112/m.25959 type:complete len:224 (-) Transcript_6112:71-742(-)
MYPTPHFATALAVFAGSSGSSGAGVWLVFTAQKRQPRVHVSPMIMMVAVPVSPFQHSPRLGHIASSHTVARPRPRTSSEICLYLSPAGARWRSHGGFVRPAGRPGMEPSLGESTETDVGPHIALAALGGGMSTPPAFASSTRRSNASPDASRRASSSCSDAERPRPTPAADPSPSAARAREELARRPASQTRLVLSEPEDEDAGPVARHRRAGRAMSAGRAET